MTNGLDRVRQPAHTGENRCWPCTVVNLTILGIGTAILAIVAAWPVALVAGGIGLAAVWLRGYLVPYTPRFAPRLVSYLPRDPFHATDGGRPEASTRSALLGPEKADVDDQRLLEALVEGGVIQPDGEQLLLAPDVRSEWGSEIERHRDSDAEDLAAAIESRLRGGTVEAVEVGDDQWLDVYADPASTLPERSLELPVATADLAAASVLEDRVEDPTVRAQAVERLRVFLEDCPRCGVELVETDTMDCCGGTIDPNGTPDQVLACPSCEAQLYTFAED